MRAVSTSADHRARLLQGLEGALREKGLAGTQIGDIVSRARTSNRAFYECFADKESAFVELIREHSVRVFETVAGALNDELPWQEQVDRAVDAYLGALIGDAILVAAISHEMPALGGRAAELHREALDRFADLFVSISREPRMRAEGVTPISPDVAVLVAGGIAELVQRATQDGRPLDELAEPMKTVIKALGA